MLGGVLRELGPIVVVAVGLIYCLGHFELVEFRTLPKHDFSVAHDVGYLEGSTAKEHTLDIYYPPISTKNQTQPVPVVFFVHGGGWKRGRKRSFLGVHQNIGKALAARGVVVVIPAYRKSVGPSAMGGLIMPPILTSFVLGCVWSVMRFFPSFRFRYSRLGMLLWVFFVASDVIPATYRVVNNHGVRHPAHAHDVAHALRWVTMNIETYGGDADDIQCLGHSAGAHLLAQMMVQPDLTANIKLPKPQFGSNFRGAILVSGTYDGQNMADFWFTRWTFMYWVFDRDPSKWVSSFPSHHSTPNSLARLDLPPIVLINAEYDLWLPSEARAWASKLREGGVNATTMQIARTNHFTILLSLNRAFSPGETHVLPVILDIAFA
eukprot:m.17437 g.17437  ORF g.17437 m.17437 type:complete len:378 (+) comp11510_c0_seq1:111-1244(+)